MPKLALAALAVVLLSPPVESATIEPGLYWDPNNPGSGYSIETQGSQLMLVVYASGQPWTYASGGYTESDAGLPQFQGLLRTDDGSAFAVAAVQFSTPRDATVWVGATQAQVTKFAFSDAGNPLLGSWAGAYTVGGNTFGFNVTFMAVGKGPVAAGGTGLVTGSPANVGGECYVSGPNAGKCLVVRTSSPSLVEAWVIDAPVNEWRGCYMVVTGSRRCYPVAGIRTAPGGGQTLAAARGMAVPDLKPAEVPTADDSAAEVKRGLDGSARAAAASGPDALGQAIGAIAAALTR